MFDADGLFEDQTVVVTGCHEGIGLAIAEAFVAAGATVVGLDIKGEPPAGSRSARFTIETGSVSDEADVHRVLRRAAEIGGSVDVMVNNAAIYGRRPFAELTVEDFDKVVAVNLRGVFLGTKLAAAAMSRGQGGSIVNIGSILGFTGDEHMGAYCATKGGITNLTRSAAVAYAKSSVRVNCIEPAAVATEFTVDSYESIGGGDRSQGERRLAAAYPMGRIVRASEVARSVMFLASDWSSAITGASLVVDCGLTATNAEYTAVSGTS